MSEAKDSGASRNENILSIGFYVGTVVFSALAGFLFNEYIHTKNETPKQALTAPANPEKTLDEKLNLPEKKQYTDIAFIIDPGHGGAKGENVGTTLIGYNLPERDYVLGVGIELEKKLEEMGYSLTETTRTGIDANLRIPDRRKKFDSGRKNIGISLHIDGHSKPETRGSKIFYNPAGKAVAEYIAQELKEVFTSARAVPTPGNYGVLKGTNPAVLVELGFGGSNREDARIAVEKKAEIVDALARALHKYHASISPK